MNFCLEIPSLKRMTALKIATLLWNKNYFTNNVTIEKISFGTDGEICNAFEWEKIEDKVLGKVQQLLLPESLKDKIICFIRPIGLEILKWLKYHYSNIYLYGILPNEFFWTIQGTIDKKKTVSVLIQDENVDIIKRYSLACIYCLEDDLPQLWEKMPFNLQKHFWCIDVRELFNDVNHEISQAKLEKFWAYVIDNMKSGNGPSLVQYENMTTLVGEQDLPEGFPSLFHYMLNYAVTVENEVTAEYFFQKLTPAERDGVLVSSAKWVSEFSSTDDCNEYIADVLFFLFAQANENQQNEIFEHDAYEILRFALDWPRQSLFNEMANHFWNFVSETDFSLLLQVIMNKVLAGFKDYDYQNVFEQLWQRSPNVFRRQFLKYEFNEPDVLSSLLKMNYEKAFLLILEDATLVEKRHFIHSQCVENILQTLIYDDNVHLLKSFIQECKFSKFEMLIFKNKVEEKVPYWIKKARDNWNKFVTQLDNLFDEDNKRKRVTEDGSSSSKRHHAN